MIVEIRELRDKVRVFADREEGGKKLAEMLAAYKGSNALVFAIAAGGVPVGAVIAEHLSLSLDVAVVSKVTLPWNTEAGFGAVAFDGTTRLNRELIEQVGLEPEQVRCQVELTKAKVQKRLKELRGDRPLPDFSDRGVILVDDGIASGFTLGTAVEALKNRGTKEIVIASPTGHAESVEDLAKEVSTVYCANVRGEFSFAVADAYRRWYDVDESEVLEILKRLGQKGVE
jgi:predicted phosphoribosyltransferase